MRTLLLLCPVYFAFAQSSQPVPPPGGIDRRGQQEAKTDNQKRGAQKRPPETPVPPAGRGLAQFGQAPAAPQAPTTKSEAQKTWCNRFKEAFTPPSWSNWILVIIGGFAAYAAIRSLNAIEKQARMAKESAIIAAKNTEHMINSERAWILVTKTWPANIGPQTGERINDFKFDLKNCGKTVGRLTGPYRARFHLVAGAEKLPDVPDYRIDSKLFGGDVRESPVHGAVLAPNQPYREISSQCWDVKITPEIFEAIEKGKTGLYFYASLKYFDFAERERELQFCYRFYSGDAHSKVPRWELSGPKEYNKHT